MQIILLIYHLMFNGDCLYRVNQDEPACNRKGWKADK